MKYKRPLVLGAGGMLAREIERVFLIPDELLWRSDHDVSQETIVDEIVAIKPDLIINCAAYTDVDGCEDDRRCFLVNGQAVQYIATAAAELGIPVVHFSSDYVFKGDSQAGYTEDSALDPINEYGAAKQVGEEFLKTIQSDHYLIRTSWLYGAGGKNFVDTITRLSQEKKELRVVNDQHGAPTWTADLAAHVALLLEKDAPFGMYHFAAEGQTTWFDVAREIVTLIGADCQILPQTSAELDRPAPRPAYSYLLNTKFDRMRSWQDMLREYLKK